MSRRRSNVRQYSAEEQALTDISKEAENRLAAKRAARAEAREIRTKEIERQEKEAEEKERLGSDYGTGKSRQQQSIASSTSSRRGSDDSSEGGDSMSSNARSLKNELRALEEKYKAAMMTSAQLDNERQSLVYQVELFKDQLEELTESHTELQREYKDKNRNLEMTKRELQAAQLEAKALREQNDYKDRLIAESGFVIVAAENGELALERSNEPPSANGPIGTGGLLLSSESLSLLNKGREGSLGMHSLDSFDSAAHTTQPAPGTGRQSSQPPSHTQAGEPSRSPQGPVQTPESVTAAGDDAEGSSVDGPVFQKPPKEGGETGADSSSGQAGEAQTGVCAGAVGVLSEQQPGAAVVSHSPDGREASQKSEQEAGGNSPVGGSDDDDAGSVTGLSGQVVVEENGSGPPVSSHEGMGSESAEKSSDGMLTRLHGRESEACKDKGREASDEAGLSEQSSAKTAHTEGMDQIDSSVDASQSVAGSESQSEGGQSDLPSIVVAECSHSQQVTAKVSEEEEEDEEDAEFFDAVSTPLPSPMDAKFTYEETGAGTQGQDVGTISEKSEQDSAEDIEEGARKDGEKVAEEEGDKEVGQGVKEGPGEKDDKEVGQGVKEDDKEVGQGIKEGAEEEVDKEVGQGVKEDDKEVGQGVKEGPEEKDGKEVGQGVKEDDKEVGQGVKDAAEEDDKEVGQGVKDAAEEDDKEVGQDIKEEAGEEVKEVAKEVDKEVGQGVREGAEEEGDKEVGQGVKEGAEEEGDKKVGQGIKEGAEEEGAKEGAKEEDKEVDGKGNKTLDREEDKDIFEKDKEEVGVEKVKKTDGEADAQVVKEDIGERVEEGSEEVTADNKTPEKEGEGPPIDDSKAPEKEGEGPPIDVEDSGNDGQEADSEALKMKANQSGTDNLSEKKESDQKSSESPDSDVGACVMSEEQVADSVSEKMNVEEVSERVDGDKTVAVCEAGETGTESDSTLQQTLGAASEETSALQNVQDMEKMPGADMDAHADDSPLVCKEETHDKDDEEKSSSDSKEEKSSSDSKEEKTSASPDEVNPVSSDTVPVDSQSSSQRETEPGEDRRQSENELDSAQSRPQSAAETDNPVPAEPQHVTPSSNDGEDSELKSTETGSDTHRQTAPAHSEDVSKMEAEDAVKDDSRPEVQEGPADKGGEHEESEEAPDTLSPMLDSRKPVSREISEGGTSEDSEAQLNDDVYDFDDIDDVLDQGSPEAGKGKGGEKNVDGNSDDKVSFGSKDSGLQSESSANKDGEVNFGSRDSGLQESAPVKESEMGSGDTVSMQSRDSGAGIEDISSPQSQGGDGEKPAAGAGEGAVGGASETRTPVAGSRESLDLEARLDKMASQESATKDTPSKEKHGHKKSKKFKMFKKIFK